MTKVSKRRMRVALLLGLSGLLAAAPLGVPGTAVARSYYVVEGPGPTGGDPTADDQPSPAPKKAPRVPVVTLGIRTNHTATGVHRAVVAWQLFLRLLASIALR